MMSEKWQIITWKDVDRFFDAFRTSIIDIGVCDYCVYSDEVTIYKDAHCSDEGIISKLSEWLPISSSMTIKPALGKPMNLIISEEKTGLSQKQLKPLFSSVIYDRKTSYGEGNIGGHLPGVPVIAFHSYKGGVGRTLSLLAFAKSWQAQHQGRLLIVDADVEAPGLTWMWNSDNTVFSYLDLLELLQNGNDFFDNIQAIKRKITGMTIQVESENSSDYFYFCQRIGISNSYWIFIQHRSLLQDRHQSSI